MQLSGLLYGTTICIYDGNPAGNKEQPDWAVLWRFVARHKVTFFGAGAAYFASCMKAGVVAAECGDLSRVRALGSTGSPLPEDVQRWGTAQLRAAQERANREGDPATAGRKTSGGATFPAAPTSAAPS